MQSKDAIKKIKAIIEKNDCKKEVLSQLKIVEKDIDKLGKILDKININKFTKKVNASEYRMSELLTDLHAPRYRFMYVFNKLGQLEELGAE